MYKNYTRKGITYSNRDYDYRPPKSYPQLKRLHCSLADDPHSEIRIIIPVTATKEDIERAINHMKIELENWERMD